MLLMYTKMVCSVKWPAGFQVVVMGIITRTRSRDVEGATGQYGPLRDLLTLTRFIHSLTHSLTHSTIPLYHIQHNDMNGLMMKHSILEHILRIPLGHSF
jgi:hypothetical protein